VLVRAELDRKEVSAILDDAGDLGPGPISDIIGWTLMIQAKRAQERV
jgi:hypothetical protein